MCGVEGFILLQKLRLGLRKAKRLLEFLAYGAFDTLILCCQRRHPAAKTIAIVHLELLGDYVIWLPYGQAMVRHLQENGQRAVLVLNAAVLPLAVRHFSNCTLVGINRVAFVRKISYRAQILRNLRQLGVELTYHDTCPRDGIVEDAAVRALGAPAWGFEETFADRPWLDHWACRRLYACLVPSMPGVHKGQRHLALLKAIGVNQQKVLHTSSDFAEGSPAPQSGSYFIIAPGSSRNERRWPVERFAAVASHILLQRPDWQCIVVGTQDEYSLAEQLVSAIEGKARNLAGETDVVALAAWIAHAQLVIGNDSAACHLAAACGVPSLVVLGGGHYGRCFPYDPKEARVVTLPAIVSVSMDCFGCDWLCRFRVAEGQPYPCIAGILPEKVFTEAIRLLDVAHAPADTPK